LEVFAEYGLTDLDTVDPTKYKSMFGTPRTFDEAWNHPDQFQRKMWRDAIRKEFSKMNQKNVFWRKIKRNHMEAGRRCVKCRWVFEIKRSGIFRARLVACGYSQIPGIDFDLVYSAVANDITFRIVLIILLVEKFKSLIYDGETAFLCGKLEKQFTWSVPREWTMRKTNAYYWKRL
jgi:hypothetical protein